MDGYVYNMNTKAHNGAHIRFTHPLCLYRQAMTSLNPLWGCLLYGTERERETHNNLKLTDSSSHQKSFDN